MSALFEEFMDSSSEHEKRRIPAVAELEANEDYRALKTFESIFGIGPDTATKFFYDLRFKSINDVKNHWSNLTRNQQIGVKYHDEFLAPVLRPEAELIAEKITEHARRLVPGAEIIIAGGYRRGESDFHDVDILISHAKEGALPGGFLLNLLKALEKRELISYTLSVSASGLQRGEDDWSGSDGLDTALLVWAGKKRKDGAEQVHRRVDIVVAPTVCAGTALLGWTGGTTFERDLRQWCQRERGWKFSSDGVWKGCERVAGTDGWEEGESWQDVEKRVMNAVGIGWRPASERCTG